MNKIRTRLPERNSKYKPHFNDQQVKQVINIVSKDKQDEKKAARAAERKAFTKRWQPKPYTPNHPFMKTQKPKETPQISSSTLALIAVVIVLNLLTERPTDAKLYMVFMLLQSALGMLAAAIILSEIYNAEK